jgi:hypothetical protein
VTAVRLNLWEQSWPLQVAECPCDVDFTDYLDEREIRGKSIFHFGSGEHHHLGRWNHAARAAHEILSVTASKAELLAYVDLIAGQPEIALGYQVLFTDVYALAPRLLPAFDLVTLFHLCEFYDPATAAYARLDDASLLDLFVDRLNPGGLLFFYTGSRGSRRSNDPQESGFAGARRLLDRQLKAGRLAEREAYKSLLVCARP